MEGYYCKFIYFSVPFLLLSNIGMKTNNYSNIAFLSSSKCQKLNHQIHLYPLRNRNGNKIFILIPYSTYQIPSKSNSLTSTNITKLNLLIISSFQLYWMISICYFQLNRKSQNIQLFLFSQKTNTILVFIYKS